MKKLLLSCLIGLGLSANGQIFQENWDGVGPGIEGWTVLDLDGNTVTEDYQDFIVNAWNKVTLNDDTNTTYSAVSTSWYDPSGQSNDWLISPPITLPAEETLLTWDSRSTESNVTYQDGYKIYISVSAGNTPEAFDTVNPLFSVAHDSNIWKTNSVNLSAFAGQTITIAFVNDSYDSNLLLVDNVKVDVAPVVPPNCSTLNTPTDNATNQSGKPTLTWTTAANAVSYDVYLDTNADPTTLVANVTGTSYTPTTFLQSATKYYWKVVPKNDNGSATGCTVRSFTVKTLAPPSCPTNLLPVDGATGVAYNPTPLSWTKPTGSGLSYDIYWGQDAENLTLLGTTSGVAVNITNTTPNTTYYWKVVPKNADGIATGCPVYSLTTSDPTYCSASGGNASYEKIGQVKFVDAANTTVFSHTNTATTPYVNVTENAAAEITLDQGKQYTFTALAQGSSFNADRVQVWIDFNGDLDFDDEGEMLLTTSKNKAPWTGTISIPDNAQSGVTRMRVRLDDTSGSASNSTPCGNGSYGQVIDYKINIQSSSVAPVCTTITSPENEATAVTPNPAHITWTAAAGATGYKIYIGTATENYDIENGIEITDTQYDAVLLADTQYFVKVVPFNAIGEATGCEEISFTTGSAEYCEAGNTINGNGIEKINKVEIKTGNGTVVISNSSSSTTGYSDYTSVTGSVNKESEYTFTATPNNFSTSTDILYVWIDYNQDGDFNDQDEAVYTSEAGKGPWNGTFTIPSDAKSGNTRMRVRLSDSSATNHNSTPCGNSSYGEVEDYTINIQSPIVVPTCTTITSPEDGATNVDSEPVQITWTAVDGADGYKVYIGTATGNYDIVNGADATATQYEAVLSADTQYFVKVVAYNTAGDAADCSEISFTTAPTLAVSGTKGNSLSLYPNPFHEVLKISDVKNVNSIFVNDMAGRNVKTLAPAAELNLSGLKEGVYIVNLQMKDGSVQSFKVIKK